MGFMRLLIPASPTRGSSLQQLSELQDSTAPSDIMGATFALASQCTAGSSTLHLMRVLRVLTRSAF